MLTKFSIKSSCIFKTDDSLFINNTPHFYSLSWLDHAFFSVRLVELDHTDFLFYTLNISLVFVLTVSSFDDHNVAFDFLDLAE